MSPSYQSRGIRLILSHIAAASENGVIGVSGNLPWDIPEDMKFFRETTKNRILIMGRKTFENIEHPLPNRLNIVISRQKEYTVPEEVILKTSLYEAIDEAKKHTQRYGNEIFIIGGGQIYKQSINMVDKIYLTVIHKKFEGDAFYPLEDLGSFKEVARDRRDSPIPFTFFVYEKK